MRLDANGYAPSIMVGWRDEGYGNVRHEVFFGTANRRISKARGFWVSISPTVHRILHENAGSGLDLFLKKYAQELFERTHTREEFISLIGKSYLTAPEQTEKEAFDSLHAGGAEKMWAMQNGAEA